MEGRAVRGPATEERAVRGPWVRAVGEGRGGRRWSLRTRLVVSAVALIAVVAAVIGAVTTIALRSYLVDQKDGQLRTAVDRAAHEGAPGGLRFITAPGQPIGTVGGRAAAPGGALGEAGRLVGPRPGDPPGSLDTAQSAALSAAARDGGVHTVSLPGLGDHRVLASRDGTIVLGFPLTDVQDTVNRLVLVEVYVAAAGLIAAGIAGGTLVGVALRPLRRVAATATRVSELPLHSGEVALYERVADAEADPRTEVGQVGAALNRMLDHVHSALHARQQSETRVRRFVADASHELRTPLASIRGYAELTRLGRERTGPDTRHALGRIEAEATRMTGLVEDLLLLARLDAGRPLSYQSTDLSPLVVDAVSDARAAGRDHRWRLELPDEPATVRGDAARLHQVLVNLLGNARSHTPAGTTVTARVRWEGPWAVVEVEDDGPGIPPGLLPHVFERFARGDASRSRHAGSTGLGLAIVQAVVVAHGGGVRVHSVPGRTVFAVRLPCSARLPYAGAPSDPSPVQGPVPSHGSRPDQDSQAGHRRSTQP
ncbi:sensor histidine kinase [Streptomyces sp. SP18CS02]|uniref:sensor histidine kinase n=1 Tax=Streptomyces sp. SP18CS02 TaxID=3002531 RepID=UPI002E7600C0|nr:HAMP domain-containing sensor histidine kinase [Streptomyces sp. SP18CS02]MEE1754248.1 HAMP domain-containing sensor histidine kinase [Streptomyces sp. SP18CS02]